jgi:hypothetical protein
VVLPCAEDRRPPPAKPGVPRAQAREAPGEKESGGSVKAEVTTRAEQIDMLDMLCQHYDDRLTTWEADFVSDLSVRMGAGESLSPKQAETLDSIFDRVTEKGRSGGHVARRRA